MTIQFASKRQWYNIQLSLCGARGLEDFSIDFVLHVHMSMIHARNTLCANPSTRFWPSRRERQNSYHCRNIYLNDNTITERFYGTVKQQEIYLVGNYPDELSAGEEIGRYIGFYNQSRRIKRCLIFLSFHVTPTARFSHNERSRLKSDSLHSSILSH